MNEMMRHGIGQGNGCGLFASSTGRLERRRKGPDFAVGKPLDVEHVTRSDRRFVK